ncbi:MAG: VOC family protein [Chloroflexi bacterium]|nr:VOC family protein [Chloroflexota bacterium]
MEPRISIITLGVSDLARSVRFYRDGLGFPLSGSSANTIAFFRTRGTVLALYPRDLLADDAHLPPGGSGFGGITLAHNAASKEQVDAVLAEAAAAGATILKPAQDVFWGGYSGYFADPDGYPWEVAWNPFSPLAPDGSIQPTSE